jgi:hypothetical protein
MTDEKLNSTATSNSTAVSMSSYSDNEKERSTHALDTEKDATTSNSKTPSVHEVLKHESSPVELKKTRSAKEVQAEELQRINTSAEGVEYPTGIKLGLISLALCLSVFLMALVSLDCVRGAIEEFLGTNTRTGQFDYCHSYSKNYGSIPLAG